MGKSEKLIRSVFELALARQPSIICIDDVDMLCLSRLDNENVRKIKNELLISIQEVGGNEIFVIGATNAPWLLDADIRTCFEKCVRVPLPKRPIDDSQATSGQHVRQTHGGMYSNRGQQYERLLRSGYCLGGPRCPDATRPENSIVDAFQENF